MGFNLVNMAYANVKGTTPKAQTVLAYLAQKADDAGVRKCFPDYEDIMAATHWSRSAVRDAINELREANLLTWVKGGRLKGAGGRALANEYSFNLPQRPMKSIGSPTTHAEVATEPKQRLPQNPCISSPGTPIITSHPSSSQPSVIGRANADADDCESEMVAVGADWKAAREKKIDQQVKEEHETRTLYVNEVAKEALLACGCDPNDSREKAIFCSTLCCRNLQDALEVIWRFKSERAAGEHKNLRKKPAALNALLAELPIVN